MNQVAINQASNLLINNPEKMQLLKDVFFKGASNDEFMLFAHACERTGLDPFMKQIYPVKRYDSNLKKEAMTIQTGIDGYRLIAERTGCYAPGREPSFTYDKDNKLVSATAYVKKLTKDGTWHEIAATAFYEEYVQRTKEGIPVAMWKKMPQNQLAKCAESLALRKAFPAELSGLYTKEEMEQGEVEVVSSTVSKAIVSKEQADELNTLLKDCDPAYYQQVMNFIARDPIKAKSLHELPVEYLERVKNAALAKRKEYQEKIASEDMQEMEVDYA